MPIARERINVGDLPWNDLLQKITKGECVPFIGAGASYPTLPRASTLAHELIDDDERTYGRQCPLSDRTDLAKVCQYLAVTHDDGGWPKERIKDRFASVVPPDFKDPIEPHRALANLCLPLYITTNYDDYMFRALTAAGARPKREFARWTEALLREEASAFDEGYRPSIEEPVVFHLHGHSDFYQSMVASEDDYLDFLVTISKEIAKNPRDASERTMLPPVIRKAILYNRLLFVGYGLADINFRVILRALLGSLGPSARKFHLSIQYSGGDAKELEDYLETYFRWSLQLNVFWGSARDFSAELAKRWNR